MSGLDLNPIRERLAASMRAIDGGDEVEATIAFYASMADVKPLLDEVERLREWNDEIKAERDELALRCLGHEGEMREAGAELHDTRAALADALQVIADLRGGS